jgi:hypothetical protein
MHMALPERIGGKKGEKPGLLVAIGVKPKGLPSRIGGPRDEEDTPAPSMDNAMAKREATKEVMAAIKDSSEMRLEDALTAFFYACDSEPHEEGLHEDEEKEEEI